MSTTSATTVSHRTLHPLAQGLPPAWASEWGEDRYGPWCSFRIKGAAQRLRWIPPGRFVMGSPPEETGRSVNEGPQHTVRFSEGFWLFDTPCTQALWETVMGQNPSQLRSPTRPVELVSWEDCQGFVKRLNGLLDGLELSLASEAQWEYACRAETKTATYVGDLEIVALNNAPVLDSIAWYGGNCGVDFELSEGWDISGWPSKQYDSKTGGSHPVGGKAPNRWGLYDMLGDVWEWCQDAYHSEHYTKSPHDGPSGLPEASVPRVIRGGSWHSSAPVVRAASRFTCVPGDRDVDLGFRCGEFRAGQVERARERD